jgi:hypothetical protein
MKKSRFPFCLKRDAQCEIGYFNQTSEGKKGDEFDVSEGSRALSV